MGRRPEPRRREQLLDGVLEFVGENGLANLSLRPLAAHLETSTYTLAYHFGSKRELLDLVSAELAVRERNNSSVSLRGTADQVRSEWSRLTSEQGQAGLAIFLEQVTLASRDDLSDEHLVARSRASIDAIRAALVHDGWDPAEAEICATRLAAVLRGLAFDLLLSGDRDRVESAVEDLLADVEERISSRSQPASPTSTLDAR